jgi:hypothetical protein
MVMMLVIIVVIVIKTRKEAVIRVQIFPRGVGINYQPLLATCHHLWMIGGRIMSYRLHRRRLLRILAFTSITTNTTSKIMAGCLEKLAGFVQLQLCFWLAISWSSAARMERLGTRNEIYETAITHRRIGTQLSKQ